MPERRAVGDELRCDRGGVCARGVRGAADRVLELGGCGGRRTVEVEGTRKGVAMMNGFSPAMLKVFMGEDEEESEPDAAEDTEWESVDDDGESTTAVEASEEEDEEDEDFTPINVMKKALMRASYDGLVVLD